MEIIRISDVFSKTMNCPDCHNDVMDRWCDTCDDLIELSGKMMSDGYEDPDDRAIEVWYKYGMIQQEMFV